MGIISTIKKIDKQVIYCNGTVKVTLGITAAPDVLTNPLDIVLVLDTSTSGCTVGLNSIKSAAKKFVSDIVESTGGVQNKTIGNNSRIGLVSFFRNAVINKELTSSVEELNYHIDHMAYGEGINYSDAFTTADTLFDESVPNSKIIVFFTDAQNINDSATDNITENLKTAGREIYCMGIINKENKSLINWASELKENHITIAETTQLIDNLFIETADKISQKSVSGIVIKDTVNPEFEITNIVLPSTGTAQLVDSNNVRWEIPELGKDNEETAIFEFFVKYIGLTEGIKNINENIIYNDNEGNKPDFPCPTVMIDCGDINPDPCPEPFDITIDGCQDSAVVDINNVSLQSLGRILELNVKLKDICPDKRIAMAVILTEIDDQDKEYSRGIKTFTIPPHTANTCKDVNIKCIKFVIPEDLDVSGGSKTSICNPRNFKARVIAHYIDSDFSCCDTITVF